MIDLEIIKSVHSALKSKRLPISDEKELQSQIRDLLIHPVGQMLEVEKRLDGKNIIDFFINGIGIEVKVKGSKREIYKQCVRYCEFPEVKALILISSVSMGFPKQINGKDCYVIKLSESWL